MLIYKVINKINNDFYIGKTINFNRRKYQHKRLMNNGCSFHFYNALRKYGWNNFKWEILEKCTEKSELNEKEIYYINLLKPAYNMTNGGDGGPIRYGDDNGMSKYKGMSYAEAYGKNKATQRKKKISDSLKKLGINHPSKRKEVREKIKKSHNKKEIKESKRKKMLSLGEKHPMKNPDIVAKNTEYKIKNWKVLEPNGNVIFIRNMKKFCKENNLQNSNMTLVADGKRKQHKGYKCIRL